MYMCLFIILQNKTKDFSKTKSYYQFNIVEHMVSGNDLWKKLMLKYVVCILVLNKDIMFKNYKIVGFKLASNSNVPLRDFS